jgi:hypothetical protein
VTVSEPIGDMQSHTSTGALRDFVDFVNGMLAGSYNDSGIEAWWQRPRSALGGLSPMDVLSDADFNPTGADAAAVRQLAQQLAGPGDAT